MPTPEIQETTAPSMTEGEAVSFQPTIHESETFTVQVANTDGGSDTQELTLEVEDDPASGAVTPWASETWDYVDTADMFAQANITDRGNTDPVLTTTGFTSTPFGGTQGPRCEYQGGFDNTSGLDWFFPDYTEPVEGDKLKPREVWVNVWVKWDDIWEVDLDHKTMFLTEEDNPVNANRWELKIGRFGSDIGLMIDNGNVLDHRGCIPPQGSSAACVGGKPDLDALFWDGEWHELRWHAKMSSDAGVADGEFETWIDGTKFGESLNIDTNSDADAYFDKIALGRNGYLIATANMYWGYLDIYTSDPGWS